MLNRHPPRGARQVLARAVMPTVSPLVESLEPRSHFSAAPVVNPAGPYLVNEGQGVQISGLTDTINVADIAPTLTLTAPSTADEASPVNVSWSYTDPGSADAVSAWNVNWGDTTADTFAGSASGATHTYMADGQYTITLTGTQANAITSVTQAITVNNVTPIVLATTPNDTIDEGARVQMSFGSTNRAGSLDGWTIAWGDGSTDAYGADTSVARHLYVDSGQYTATVYAQEPDGGHGSTTVDFTVRNVAPTVALTDVPASGVEGSTINVRSAVADAGINDTETYGWTVYRNGDHYALPDGTDLSGTTFAFTPTDNGSYVVRLSVVDDEGAMTTVNSDPIDVTNAAPTAIITGEPGPSINEGAPVTLTATPADAGTDDTFTYAWSVTKDDAAFALPHGIDKTGADFTFTPTDNGSYVATVVVTDNDGDSGTADSMAVTVDNVAPTAGINGAPATGREGSAIIVAADPHDAGTADSFTYTWSVEKDGDSYALGATAVHGPTLSFVPTDNGSYVIHLDIADDDGATASATSSAIDVANVAPTADLTGDAEGVEGTALNFSVAAHDAGADDTHTYLWTVTKNDASFDLNDAADTGSSFSFTPDNNGAYAVSVVVMDDDGDSVTKTANLTVTNAAPTAAITGDTTADEGDAMSFGSTVTDPSAIDTVAGFRHTWTVKKGDDTVAQSDEADFTFTPAVHGTYTLTLVATDIDGDSTITTSGLTVANVAPTNAAIAGDLSGYHEGDTVSLTGSADDASGDALTLTWQVLDGDDVFASGEGRHFNFTAARGDYSIVLTATDTAGAEATTQQDIHIDNLAPTAALTAPANTMLVGSSAAFGLAFNDVPVLQGLGVTWDFGDGTGASNDYIGGQNVVKKHSFAARGTYTVTATIDDGLDTTVVSRTVNVSEAAVIADPMDTSKTALFVTGSDANDSIAIAQQSNGKYAVTFNGTNLGTTFAPTGRIYVYGNGGGNQINISGTAGSVVFAGGGASTVNTGSGDDIVIGSPWGDRISGGDGRDILIGGAGADVLHGNDGEDLLIAGTLAKTDASTLSMISAKWFDAAPSALSRRAAMLAMFGPKQLIADSGANQLYGDTRNDWLFANTRADRLKDLTKTDLVN